MTNEELIALALGGDQDAYTELYTRVKLIATKICYKKIKGYPNADILPHDIAARILMRLNQFKGDSLFSTWVIRICCNEITMLWRRNHLRIDKTVPLDTPIQDNSKTFLDILAYNGAQYHRVDAKLDVKSILSKIKNKKHTTILHQLLANDYTEKELSAKTGIATQTIGNARRNCIRKAKKISSIRIFKG